MNFLSNGKICVSHYTEVEAALTAGYVTDTVTDISEHRQ